MKKFFKRLFTLIKKFFLWHSRLSAKEQLMVNLCESVLTILIAIPIYSLFKFEQRYLLLILLIMICRDSWQYFKDKKQAEMCAKCWEYDECTDSVKQLFK